MVDKSASNSAVHIHFSVDGSNQYLILSDGAGNSLTTNSDADNPAKDQATLTCANQQPLSIDMKALNAFLNAQTNQTPEQEQLRAMIAFTAPILSEGPASADITMSSMPSPLPNLCRQVKANDTGIK